MLYICQGFCGIPHFLLNNLESVGFGKVRFEIFIDGFDFPSLGTRHIVKWVSRSKSSPPVHCLPVALTCRRTIACEARRAWPFTKECKAAPNHDTQYTFVPEAYRIEHGLSIARACAARSCCPL